MIHYTETTQAITVKVQPVYLDGRSDVLHHRFVFAYFIEISNNGTEAVQLLRRHWYIRDGRGNLEEVEGEGVVGQQPIIEAGQSHSYNSYCVLSTFEGSMEGTYLMEKEDGERFRVSIPRFTLRAAAN